MSTEAEASTETITLPSEPEALAQAIVERYPDAHDLNVIFNAMKAAIPGPLWIDLDADLVAQMGGVAEMPKEIAGPRLVGPPIPPPLPAPTDFSDTQQRIIAYIWRQHQAEPESFESWGIYWSPNRVFGEMTPSQRASTSRALHRLERRGILDRFGYPSGGNRTVYVKLTDYGSAVARRLTSVLFTRMLTSEAPTAQSEVPSVRPRRSHRDCQSRPPRKTGTLPARTPLPAR